MTKKSLKVFTKTFTKTHKKEKAANAHVGRIKKRGGAVVKTKTAKGYKLEYAFKK